ncbi:MAG: LacI family DNA-binding transcriptional regulator [Micromonosporaceae bacterium]
MPPAGPVTLTDVARRAGVSLATASRALHGGDRTVGDALRERVLAAAAELDYTPNAQAQAMARGRTDMIGLLVHDIADPYFSSIAAGVIEAAEPHGLLVTVASTVRRPERELRYVAALRRQRARAVILAGSRDDDPDLLRRLGAELTGFASTGGRVVLIGQRALGLDTVVVENRSGARALGRALLELGHRRFGVLAGPRGLLTARDRLAGFREALRHAGAELPDPYVIHGEFTRDGGYAAMSQLLDRAADASTPGATCVFAVNDVMAVGAVAALRDRGVRVPDEIAVAGFDDIDTLHDITPALTTVRLPLERLGATAVELMTQPPADRPRLRRIAGEVVVRASTPPLAAR